MKSPNALEKLLFGSRVKSWSNLAHRLTGYRYLFDAKPDPSSWSIDLHEGTSWRYFRQPEAEKIMVWKARDRVVDSKAFPWAGIYQGVFTEAQDPSTANRFGVGAGQPMQSGSDETRSVTWGWRAWGESFKGRIAKPASGVYWRAGFPNAAYDGGVIVVAGDTVYEAIQFDPDLPVSLLANQALGLGVFQDGVLIEGRATGAGKVANSAYLWDRMSDMHTQGLNLFDYYGGDGQLAPGIGIPECGQTFVLDPNSRSAKAMLSKGGDCAKRAMALIQFGCRINDRSGYGDVKNNTTDVGTEPHPCTLKLQSGTWPGSNIAEFTIELTDLRLATEFY